MTGRLKKPVLFLPAIGVMAALFAACGDRVATYELAGTTMGTTYSIQVVGNRPGLPDSATRNEIEATLERIEGRMSTYLDASEISRFNADRSGDWFEISAETCRLVERAIGWSEASDGAFDVTVAPVVEAWGFGPTPAPAGLPDEAEIARLQASVGVDYLETDCSVPALRKRRPALGIDLSGFAKGYAVDEVAALLARRGYPDFLVEIGGELSARGRNASGLAWRIAIENPAGTGATPAGILSLRDEAMATSGDYRNFFEYGGKRYSHTIDPRTGRPVAHELTAVTVVAGNTADADALATALLVLGPEAGAALADRLGLAARFILRQGADYRVRDTPALRPLIDRS